MKINKLLPAALLTLALAFNVSATSTDPIKDKELKKTEKIDNDKTIVSVAASNKNFTTLVAAVKAAGLVDVLNGDGPFTVFAPIDDAFGKLPKGTVEELLKPENKKTLTSILTYHVVSGKFNAKQVLAAIKANNGKFDIKTVQGNTLTASVKDGKVILTDSKGNTSTIIITDVEASNGIIHAIDSVVMP